MTRVRHLRKNSTRHERILWRHPRNRQLQDWKFRRQHPVDRYAIDFYCPEARLAIELDGGGHNFAAKESLNQARTRFLASKDIQILRFWNHEISQELDSASWKHLVSAGATKKPLTLIISLCAKGEANACRRLRAKT